MQKDCHLRLMLMSNFCVRPITLYRERLETVYILTLCTRSFADQFKLRLLNLFFFFIYYETITKAKFIFLCKTE